MRFVLIFFGLLSLSVIVGCSADNAQTIPEDIDPMLIGSWYRIDSLDSSFPGPKIRFFGFEITVERQYYTLGIHWMSGNVTRTGGYASLSSALDGILTVNRFYEPTQYAYSFSEGNLILRSGSSRNEYQRIFLGAHVADPSTATFSAQSDIGSISLPAIAPSLPAFASAHSQSKLLISADIVCPNFEYPSLGILINDFHGIASYPVDSGSVSFRAISGDFMLSYESPRGAGYVFIQRYDTSLHRCDGRFSFVLVSGLDSLCFSSGHFSLPLFH
jgi:hypothetical protein